MSAKPLVTLYFHRHLPSAFSEAFRRMLIQYDIVLVELSVKYDEVDDFEWDLRKLSKGELALQRMLAKYPNGDHSLFEALHKSEKQIYMERSPVTPQEYDEYVKLERSVGEMILRNIGVAADLKGKALRKFAEMNARRDVALANLIARIVMTNPGKRLLVYRGPGHELKLTTELGKRGIACDRKGEQLVDPESRVLEKLENSDSVSPAEVLELLRR